MKNINFIKYKYFHLYRFPDQKFVILKQFDSIIYKKIS